MLFDKQCTNLDKQHATCSVYVNKNHISHWGKYRVLRLQKKNNKLLFCYSLYLKRQQQKKKTTFWCVFWYFLFFV